MKEMDANEAKNHWHRIRSKVVRFTLTEHGRLVAMLTPPPQPSERDMSETVRTLRTFRTGKLLGDLSIHELVDVGRRY